MSAERSGVSEEENDVQDPERKEEAEDAEGKSEQESEESFPASDPPSW